MTDCVTGSQSHPSIIKEISHDFTAWGGVLAARRDCGFSHLAALLRSRALAIHGKRLVLAIGLPWGEIVFHYGRWLRDARFGWVWVPSWVCRRHADNCCGWAPLPPSARFQVGAGWSFNGRVGVDLDFGFGER